jgi:hypothetical protein
MEASRSSGDRSYVLRAKPQGWPTEVESAMKKWISLVFITLILVLYGSPSSASQEEAIRALQEEIRSLQRQVSAQKDWYEERLQEMQRRINALGKSDPEGSPSERNTGVSSPGGSNQRPSSAFQSTKGLVQRMNPDISVIIDTNYARISRDDVNELYEEVAGFGHAHGGGEDHGHSHGRYDPGFNLREVELFLSAEVDPYFKGYTTIAFHNNEIDLEEAVLQTTFLPLGLQAKGGKFYSDFGYINRQHPHEWDFFDRPLIYELALGDHGLLEKGLQLTWLAPTRFSLLFGIEALQGENERTFDQVEGEVLPDRDGPRLGVGWVKVSPNLPQRHGLQFGLFGALGRHQEAHDGNSDGEIDHWLDGDAWFAGGDLVYKYHSGRAYGEGNFTFQGEYFFRRKDLVLQRHDLRPEFEGRNRIDEQDGLYVQAIYGFLPRWRAGGRLDLVGLRNLSRLPSGREDNFDSSYRYSGMMDYSPTEFSRFRVQLSRGHFAIDDGGRENFWEFFVQGIFSLGAHGAHRW